MLNAIRLALHDWPCFGSCLLTFLVVWTALCCISFSEKCYQVSVRSQHRAGCTNTQKSGGKVNTNLSKLGLLYLDGMPLCQFLCYNPKCKHCYQAIRKRLLRNNDKWARMRASYNLHSSSSSNSITSCRDVNTDSSSHSSARRNSATQTYLTSFELSCQPETKLRKQRKLHLKHTTINQKILAILGPDGTITFDPGLLSQASQLTDTDPVQPMSDVCHKTRSLPVTVSTSNKRGNLPPGMDSHCVSRLEQELDFWKLLKMHMLRKSIETKLRAFPTIVQQSHRMYTQRIAVRTARTPHHSSTAPIFFCSLEALFLKEEVQEALELHIREKKLHHKWGLPGSLLTKPQVQQASP
ncbi:uncharacterized protein LOC107306139 isoform X2 [Coturnix japonica]|uniref:uncharacterized protein LOC107306139 isoform X2 n=1 Tax=Coturnix japonica TaxID=93934 RepID=UPI000777CD73|nr:uncharacterized protein LOC107306139 isoform X2 [Coturnix japonica]